MNKTVIISLIVMSALTTLSVVYDTFIFKRKLLRELTELQCTEEYRGEMKYLIFSSKYGGMIEINYTLDSMEYEANKRGFYK